MGSYWLVVFLIPLFIFVVFYLVNYNTPEQVDLPRWSVKRDGSGLYYLERRYSKHLDWQPVCITRNKKTNAIEDFCYERSKDLYSNVSKVQKFFTYENEAIDAAKIIREIDHKRQRYTATIMHKHKETEDSYGRKEV